MTEVSASLKAARAVDGDDWFVARMNVICVTEGIEYSQRLAYLVALSVADKIVVDEFMTVDTSGVTDDELQAAVLTAASDLGAVIPDTANVARMETSLLGFTSVLLEDTGRSPGKPWTPPVGAHDAYPKDWEVLHDGKTWVSLVDWNVWVPGVSGWREVVEEGGVPMWVQPTGAHDAYQKGDQVSHNGNTWTSTVDANVWEPSAYGWTKD